MSLTTLAVLAIAMSMDAFAAALAAGAARPLSGRHIARTALIFGTVEGLMPLIGWLAGRAAEQWIADWDHWLAFILLAALGGRMIWESRFADHRAVQPPPANMRLLALTALATGIDSMVAGIGLALIQAGIVAAALMIGMAATLMTAAGMILGRVLGSVAGQYAGMAGGVMLIGIGTSVLLQHTNWL